MSSLVRIICRKHSLEEIKNLVFRVLFRHHTFALQESKLSLDLTFVSGRRPPPQQKQLWSVQEQLQGGDVTLKNPSTHLQLPVKGLSATQDACLVTDNQRLAAFSF